MWGGKSLCVSQVPPQSLQCPRLITSSPLSQLLLQMAMQFVAVSFFKGDMSTPLVDWCMGRDIKISPEKDEKQQIILGEINQGKGKYFCGGPSCHFCGKDIPTMFFVLPSGGITTEILVKILQNLDEQHIFEKEQNGCTPIIILDGHDSRLKPSILNYINEIATKWKLLFGVPYGTSYWQVANSAEQNGSYKMAWYEEKCSLNKFKGIQGMPLTINAEDIMPMVNRAWDKSFGCKNLIKKAVAMQGWNPLNHGLLLHLEIQKT